MFDFSHLGGMGGIMSMLPQVQAPQNVFSGIMGQAPQMPQPMADQGQGGGLAGMLGQFGQSPLGTALGHVFPQFSQLSDPAYLQHMQSMPFIGNAFSQANTAMNNPFIMSLMSRFGLGNNAGAGSFPQNGFAQNGFAGPGGSSYQT